MRADTCAPVFGLTPSPGVMGRSCDTGGHIQPPELRAHLAVETKDGRPSGRAPYGGQAGARTSRTG